MTSKDLNAEIDGRLRLAAILGTGAERRALRQRLGLTVAQVAALTGLAYGSVRHRESDRWRLTRGSVESEQGWRYVRLIARGKGIPLDD